MAPRTHASKLACNRQARRSFGLRAGRELLCDAPTLAKERRTCPLAAHCHLGLGTPYQRAGRREQGWAGLTTAAEMYGAMELAWWLTRAEAELAGVPG